MDPLEQALALFEGGEPALKIRGFLERHFDPADCPGLMDCLDCRHRFRHKFDKAHLWWLSREAAEQATDSRIARWRAELLSSLNDAPRLTELGCGIGGDTVFLSRSFEVTAYEKNPNRAELAQKNVENLGRSEGCEIVQGESDCASLEGDILYADPARRHHSRLLNPDDWIPPLSEVARCYREGRFQLVAVKCAPGLPKEEVDKLDLPTTTYFVSLDGDLKEAFLVIGRRGPATAVMLREGEATRELTTNHRNIEVREPKVGAFLHNPNPAILRAGALDALAAELEAGIAHPKIGYLIGPRSAEPALATSFEIIDTFELKWSALKKRLAGVAWTEYEYLGRGVPFSQNEVRRRVSLPPRKKRAPLRGSVIIFREDQGYRVVLGTRVEGNNPQAQKQ